MKKNKDPRVLFVFKKKNIFSFKKNGPNEFLYGLDYIKKFYPCTPLFANNYKDHFLFKLLEKIIAYQTKLGIYFQVFLNNKNKIKKSDILFAINDGVSLGLLFFKLIGKLDNKIIVLIQGLHDRYRYFKWNKLLVFFYKKLLAKAEVILTLSSYEKNLLVKSLQINPNKIQVFYFGADLNYWQKNRVRKQKKEEFVLTVGSDIHRDYDLLLNHYNLKIPLKFITKALGKKQLKQVKNMPIFENYQQISNEKLRTLYYQAKFVIIPLKTTYATSGLSTMVQSLAMEKPVLVAKAPALQELFTNYQHVLYYDINSPRSFQQKLKELNENRQLRNKLAKNGKAIVNTKYNSYNMGKGILKLFQSIK